MINKNICPQFCLTMVLFSFLLLPSCSKQRVTRFSPSKKNQPKEPNLEEFLLEKGANPENIQPD